MKSKILVVLILGIVIGVLAAYWLGPKITGAEDSLPTGEK